jgi:DNA-binding NtrC family response regulator
MPPVAVPVLAAASRVRLRTAIVASADRSFRQKISETLIGLRWKVREAENGAEAWATTMDLVPEAIIVDSWFPDLNLAEFLKDFRENFPQVDLVTTGSFPIQESPRGPYRQELLYALRRCQDTDTAAWNTAPALSRPNPAALPETVSSSAIPQQEEAVLPEFNRQVMQVPEPAAHTGSTPVPVRIDSAASVARQAVARQAGTSRLPELVGDAPCMLEVSRRIRLVAPRSTPVLIEGPTGSGKELVAEALHRLSTRSRKPFIAINCAAIPEALLEAELFGHTRGAFTGAVHGRVGRIEAADGGTLFLDEIGEMPLALQSKLLRFVECGELQRVGDNETVRVDVRIIAATHQELAAQTQTGAFRSDLYYRLAVFLIRTPALAEHEQDLPLLVNHFLERMGRENPMKQVDAGALEKLSVHDWPGNVRELEHVLERAAILAGESSVLTAEEIDFGVVMH